ncbi:MAG: arginine--tRNA ligase, partial [Dinghuibacter sp.]|nr:arginine--tRNA ligase [Dinghuibacter sp.]
AAAIPVQINTTKPEFEGDYTIVLFSLVKLAKKSPEALGAEIGARFTETNKDLVTGFNVIKGFLNLLISDEYWTGLLNKNYNDTCYGKKELNQKKVMVEYSSPNTNKPIHLGHLRNNFLGWSMAEIYKASGYEVIKTCIVNDRGIHICKSMLAWQLFGNGATPESTGLKGDHLVGHYYVLFSNAYKEEVEQLVAGGMNKEQAEKEAHIMKAAQEMLLKWEQGDPETIALWKTMNQWVYAGFDETYKKIGSDFDKIYYESDTYLLGKEIVQQGLEKGVFYKKDDGSVWINLEADGLDEKLLLRKDGTSVYITQDIGLAQQKYEQYHPDHSIYVVGNEQDYHFQVLKLISMKLGIPASENIYHLSYGMVELPSGKMKSREGTVVDADDLLDEITTAVAHEAAERDKEKAESVLKKMDEEEKKQLFHTLALGAMKFYLLRVQPKKRMVFDPTESIDLHGFTGPYIQYAYTRTCSVIRKAENTELDVNAPATPLLPLEKELLILLEQYEGILEEAVQAQDPSVVANYIYQVAKTFNSFYTEHKFLDAETPGKQWLRLRINNMTGVVIKSAMKLLGIDVPERM